MNSGNFTKGNKGKPKGAVNKTTKLVKEVIAEVFVKMQDDPEVNLLSWGTKNPTEFYKLASKLIPMQMDVAANINNLQDAHIVFC